LTPHTVHYREAIALNLQRAEALNTAFVAHPQRFKGIAPKPPALPTAAWINPPKKEIAPPTINPICSQNY
jgi:putative transposase